MPSLGFGALLAKVVFTVLLVVVGGLIVSWIAREAIARTRRSGRLGAGRSSSTVEAAGPARSAGELRRRLAARRRGALRRGRPRAAAGLHPPLRRARQDPRAAVADQPRAGARAAARPRRAGGVRRAGAHGGAVALRRRRGGGRGLRAEPRPLPGAHREGGVSEPVPVVAMDELEDGEAAPRSRADSRAGRCAGSSARRWSPSRRPCCSASTGHDLERRPTPEANTFSYSALGYHGLFEFLRSMGLGVVTRQAPAGGVGPGRPLLLAEPDGRDPERLKTVYEEARTHRRPRGGAPQVDAGGAAEEAAGLARQRHPDPAAEVRRVLGELGDAEPAEGRGRAPGRSAALHGEPGNPRPTSRSRSPPTPSSFLAPSSRRTSRSSPAPAAP